MSTAQLYDRFQQALSSAYTLRRELGGGGMSRVFVAEEIALGRLVVIKILSPDLAQGLSADRFAREIRLAARLQHPHIVPLFSAGEVDGLPYYTMPFVDGESLGTRLAREGNLPIASALHILRDIARALEYAHSNDVVHRDIKPANVLLSGNSASVTDFGIAKAVFAARTGRATLLDENGLTQLGIAVGTPLYMAPEQVAADPSVDHRADLYSFGCLAYEALTGHPPFRHRSRQALFVAHITEAPPPVDSLRGEVPGTLTEMVMQCLAKSPADRPASATEVLAAMDAGATRSRMASTAADPTESIAVMPFASMSADKENEYFADGITEDIINALAQLDGLRVACRTSSFSFKGTKYDLQAIGEKLNVDNVLEGSVRKSGNFLRITTQLVKVSDGYDLWSERYDREMTDIFAVQDEIATAIASKFKLSLARSGESAKAPTGNIEAYELFLKGRVLFYRRGRFIRSAIECFERAVALDPRFAQAQAALADALTLCGYYGAVPPKAIIDRARAAAQRAVSLAPEIAESRHALALWTTLYGSNDSVAMAEWEHAMDLGAPSTQVRCSYALWRCALLMQDWDTCVSTVESAVAADPLSGYANSLLALVKMFARRFDGMLADAKRGLELDPESFWSHWTLQRAYHYAGMSAEAFAQGQATLAMSGRHPWAMSELAVEYATIGDRGGAEAIYGELVSRAHIEHIPPTSLAVAATCAGRVEEAVAACHRAVDERDSHIRWSIVDRWDGWQALHTQPGWEDIRRRIENW
ncbi:MAG: protein kinase [Gemmatimonadaceae bacterium]|nr:protein kinase [Gemmatimonadaceae bacterium]